MDTKKKRDPYSEALTELHGVLSDAISAKLKAKVSAKKIDRSKAKADEPETELGESGEASDEDDPRTTRRKSQFGHGGK